VQSGRLRRYDWRFPAPRILSKQVELRGWVNRLHKAKDFRRLASSRLKRGDRIAGLEPPPQPFIVREYANFNRRAKDGVRRAMTDTVYWHPVLVMPDGKGERRGRT